MADLKVGQTIETSDGRKGIIRFIGDVHVAPGQFLGLELPNATGKNDGSPAPKVATKPTTAPRPKSQPPKPTPQSAKPRPSSMGRPSLKPPSTAAPSPTVSSAATSRLSISQPRKSSVASSTSLSALRPTKPARVSSVSSATSKPDIGALETKIRHLEQKQAEDREKLKDLDKLRQERDRFSALLKKLEGKCQEFHHSNSELKAQLQQSESEVERLSRTEQENESILELATLDREMAEEKAEAIAAELDTVRQKLEEYELELDILRSEAEIMGQDDISEEDKRAAGVYQLQAERDRLRQALIMLKDITEQNELDLRTRIQELESDSTQLEDTRSRNTDLEAQLANSTAIIEDLRQQLDAATDWEDIIEDLSDQNQQFKDQLAEKDQAIIDLENLKELNDELEIHHLEQANELRAELEARDVELAEHVRKVTQQDAAIADQEMLITKFRDLVVDLQGKMTDVESSKVMSEEQAKDVTGRFNEVMELNRRLRNANITSTVKTITAELQKLQADEAEEELAIVKHYLPDSPEIYKNDSLRAYFRAKRITFKTSLVGSLMRSLALQSSTPEGIAQPLTALVQHGALQQLTYLNLKSARIWSAVASCTLDEFVAFGPAYEDLDPVERTLERCLDSLKKDDLDYEDISDSLRRSNVIMDGVTSTYDEVLATHPEDEIIFLVSSIKSNFQLIKSSFDTIKSCIQMVGTIDGEWENGTQYVLERLSRHSDASSDSIIATGKLVRTLETLRSDSLCPRFPLGVKDIADQNAFLELIAQRVQKFAAQLTNILLSHDEGDSESIYASEVSKHLSQLEEMFFPEDELFDMGNIIPKIMFWNEHASVLMNNVEIEHGPAPWVLKANEIEANKKKTAEAERQLQVLTVEHHATILQIRERDEIIDTKELQIEHLTAKHREAMSRVEDLTQLQTELREATSDRERLRKEINTQQNELLRLKDQSTASEHAIPTPLQPTTPPKPAGEPPKEHTSGAFKTFIQALANENHWLRRRENHEMFSLNLKAMFAKMREFQ
ncbi:uncharacterized protein BDR25DRAFT_169089, partial [Lindgomyces ingoldianus]